MRLTKEQANQNREAILETAARLFKTKGIDSVAVADLMKAAGFTHGGFYNHFESKSDLAVETIRHAFAKSLGGLKGKLTANSDPERALAKALSDYVAPAHRDEASGGCPTGSLPVDVSRQPRQAQAAFAEGLEGYIALIAEHSSVDRRSAIATLTALVGAIILARAVRGGRPELSDEILQTVNTIQTAARRARLQTKSVKTRAKSRRKARAGGVR